MESIDDSSTITSPNALSTFTARIKERQSKSPLASNISSANKTPTSNELILYPPSKTIGDSMKSLASTTVSQLELVWDEVGYTPEERAAQIAEFLTNLKKLCKDKVAEEQGVAEQFRNAIADAKEERRIKSAALKIEMNSDLQPQVRMNYQLQMNSFNRIF